MNETLSNIISTGMNNPDCAYFVGAWSGQFLGIEYLIIVSIIYIVFRFVDKLILFPILDRLKSYLSKWWKK